MSTKIEFKQKMVKEYQKKLDIQYDLLENNQYFDEEGKHTLQAFTNHSKLIEIRKRLMDFGLLELKKNQYYLTLEGRNLL